MTIAGFSPLPPRQPERQLSEPEKLLALALIASILGIPVYTVRRAAKNGEFPIYRVGRGRARARLSEVVAAINAARANP